MNVVLVALAASLGAGFMAILHELVKWDANRRLAGQLAGTAPAADRPAPAGRHHRAAPVNYGLRPVPVWDGAGQRLHQVNGARA